MLPYKNYQQWEQRIQNYPDPEAEDAFEDYIQHVWSVINNAQLQGRITLEFAAYHNSDWDGDIYFGVPLAHIEEDQTYRQFKQQVKKELLAISEDLMFDPPADMQLEVLEACWMS